MDVPISVSGMPQLRDLAARFRATDSAQIERDAADELMDSAGPAVAAVQARVLAAEFPAVPSKGGGGSTGLRARLAAATQARRLRSAVRFVVADPGGQAMARYTEGVGGRWRHPVFGNRRAWVQQQPDPWFFPTILAEEPRLRAAVDRAVDKIVRRVMG